uniref:G-protein coupled receptors family 1 profile domain-containing protein n=1 Tax=Oncorhynchus kisutch TaxID=8019 RepID=A0A8C7K819_ONCKI
MSSVNFTGKNVEEFTITGFDHLSHQKLLGFLIFITYFLVLLGSGTNICIILTDRRLHTPMYLLICNLAVVDIMFTTSTSITMISLTSAAFTLPLRVASSSRKIRLDLR